jgi:hypothetical protein
MAIVAWDFVIPHFNELMLSLELTTAQRSDAETKCDGIARKVWTTFWSDNAVFDPTYYAIVGGYGKRTAIRPPTDVDVAVQLPPAVLTQVESVQGNKQSYLLRLVKDAILARHPGTNITQDGQVVVVSFGTYLVEVLPFFFDRTWGTWRFPDTNAGGRWRICKPLEEVANLDTADQASVGKARHLARLMKAWKRECSVPVESFVLELIACAFVAGWQYRYKTFFYYDWMIRDFFEYLITATNRVVNVPGSAEYVTTGDAWKSRAESAFSRALKACAAEHVNNEAEARIEWRKIFGIHI